MKLWEKRDFCSKNWTSEQCQCILFLLMGRKLRILTAFEPTRLGQEPIHQAYKLVVPVCRRLVRDDVTAEKIKATASKPHQKKRNVS